MNKKKLKESPIIIHRRKVDQIDEEILRLLKRRESLIKKIGKYKKSNGIKIISRYREESILRKQLNGASKYNIDPELIRGIYNLIFKHSRKIQRNI